MEVSLYRAVIEAKPLSNLKDVLYLVSQIHNLKFMAVEQPPRLRAWVKLQAARQQCCWAMMFVTPSTVEYTVTVSRYLRVRTPIHQVYTYAYGTWALSPLMTSIPNAESAPTLPSRYFDSTWVKELFPDLALSKCLKLRDRRLRRRVSRRLPSSALRALWDSGMPSAHASYAVPIVNMVKKTSRFEDRHLSSVNFVL